MSQMLGSNTRIAHGLHWEPRTRVTYVQSAAGASITRAAFLKIGDKVLAILPKVITALGVTTGLTGFKLGLGGDTNRYGEGYAITAGAQGTLAKYPTGEVRGEIYSADTDLLITSEGGNFDATGTIVVVAYVERLVGTIGKNPLGTAFS